MSVVVVLSPQPLCFVFDNSKNTRNELARPVMGTIFLVVLSFPHHPIFPVPSFLICSSNFSFFVDKTCAAVGGLLQFFFAMDIGQWYYSG